jgi:hypothetical protein
MKNFISILLLILTGFCRYGFKEQTLFIIPTFFINIRLQLVLEPTISCSLLHTFLQLAIHVDNFNLEFSLILVFYRASAILQIQKQILCLGIFADSKDL